MKKAVGILLISNKTKRIFSVMLIFVGLMLLLGGSIFYFKSVETMTSPMNGITVLIDPGHGGADAGASEGDAIEKTLNLEIAMLLKNYIEENGGVCYLTRAVDTNTADPNRPKGISQKMSDLKMRKQNIDEFKADIFVSIHMNKFGESKYSGLQVFYDDNLPQNKLLAEAVQNSTKEVVDPQNTRTAKATGEKIYVLKGNKIPSILVECGFLSNPQERENLKNPQYRQKVAWGIYVGIMRFISR